MFPTLRTLAIVAVFAAAVAADPPPRKKLPNDKLAGADLRGADLRNTDLRWADLRRADLRGADLSGATLERAELADTDLRGVVGLSAADVGPDLNAKRADFRDTDLRGVVFRGHYFEGADFRGADLRGAILSARFHDAKFDVADVRGAVFLCAWGTEPVHADLQTRGAIVTAADFARTVREGRDYTGSDLSGVGLAETNLDDAKFTRAHLHSAVLRGATLRRARCDGANVCWAKLASADMSGADLRGASFVGADLTGADLSNADCRGAEFGNARLNGAKFAGANLSGADFRGADLTGADLTGSTRDGVKWEAAITTDLQGVTPEEQKVITEQAARWKHDLERGFNDFVRVGSLPGWLFAWAVGAVVLVLGRRRVPRHPSLRLLMAFHLLALLPAVVYPSMCLCGVSPTAQLSGNLGGWSMWVHVFPLAVGIVLFGLLAFLPAVVAAWAMALRHPTPGLRPILATATLFTGLSLVAAVGVLGLLAPTA